MEWMIPGTVLRGDRQEAEHIEKQFSAMFMGGDLVLSQVAAITGLEPYHIQNWVKRGFLTPPQKKHYNLRQLCRILNINMLKSVLSMEEICSLLQYVNGELDDISDDMIDDAVLYFMFVKLAARAKELYDPQQREAILEEALRDYEEPVPGAAERVKEVLRIMLIAWLAARMAQETEKMLKALQERND